jgi:hypothetical protein
MANRLDANGVLNVYEELDAPNGKTRLVMQDDGNLVLYRTDTGVALWDTRTVHTPVFRAIMQGDGNFVCYSPEGHAYWATGTWGNPGSHIVMQDDGNLVLYSANNNALWASSTVQDFDPLKYDSGDVHLSTGFWMHTTASMSAAGIISGKTRTWSTLGFQGFHASVAAVVLDDGGKVIWPEDAQVTKRQYGVDGPGIRLLLAWGGAGPHDRTDSWVVQVPSDVLPHARKVSCIHFLDPKNMLLTDLKIAGDDLAKVAQAIAAFMA